MSNEKMPFGEYLKMRRMEDTELTREQAAELTTISLSRLDKIERDVLQADARDVWELSRVYKLPDLCNYYCANECPIGCDPDSNISKTIESDYAHIVLSLLNSINRLNDQKNRFIEISADGKIDDNEYRDFFELYNSLREISEVADSLSLWVRKQLLSGGMDIDRAEDLISK